jgi:hypothetical protein
VQAQKDGSLTVARNQYPVVAAVGQPETRADVVSQLDKAEPSVYSGN